MFSGSLSTRSKRSITYRSRHTVPMVVMNFPKGNSLSIAIRTVTYGERGEIGHPGCLMGRIIPGFLCEPIRRTYRFQSRGLEEHLQTSSNSRNFIDFPLPSIGLPGLRNVLHLVHPDSHSRKSHFDKLEASILASCSCINYYGTMKEQSRTSQMNGRRER